MLQDVPDEACSFEDAAERHYCCKDRWTGSFKCGTSICIAASMPSATMKLRAISVNSTACKLNGRCTTWAKWLVSQLPGETSKYSRKVSWHATAAINHLFAQNGWSRREVQVSSSTPEHNQAVGNRLCQEAHLSEWWSAVKDKCSNQKLAQAHQENHGALWCRPWCKSSSLALIAIIPRLSNQNCNACKLQHKRVSLVQSALAP